MEMIRNITKDTTFDAVILADGDFPTMPFRLVFSIKQTIWFVAMGQGLRL